MEALKELMTAEPKNSPDETKKKQDGTLAEGISTPNSNINTPQSPISLDIEGEPGLRPIKASQNNATDEVRDPAASKKEVKSFGPDLTDWKTKNGTSLNPLQMQQDLLSFFTWTNQSMGIDKSIENLDKQISQRTKDGKNSEELVRKKRLFQVARLALIPVTLPLSLMGHVVWGAGENGLLGKNINQAIKPIIDGVAALTPITYLSSWFTLPAQLIKNPKEGLTQLMVLTLGILIYPIDKGIKILDKYVVPVASLALRVVVTVGVGAVSVSVAPIYLTIRAAVSNLAPSKNVPTASHKISTEKKDSVKKDESITPPRSLGEDWQGASNHKTPPHRSIPDVSGAHDQQSLSPTHQSPLPDPTHQNAKNHTQRFLKQEEVSANNQKGSHHRI